MYWMTEVNDFVWSYILIAMLIGLALWFTVKSGFVQFTMFKEMVRLLFKSNEGSGGKRISSFQAFAISLGSRVGTGNLAGVATAITVGGPGAVFWMWIIALLGSCSGFVEATLAQLYKRKQGDGYIGGPAYYIKYGLHQPWWGVLFSVLIIITFSYAFTSVQSNTICAAFESAFNLDYRIMAVVLTVLTGIVIFGGVRRIARFSSVLVPIMAIGYILLALFVLIMNIDMLPAVLGDIVADAMGWREVAGGGVGAALMQGIRRGLFSNEAGMGSAPNAAATAHVSHPVKQGLVQALGVFIDTLVICTCTAFVILLSGVPISQGVDGVQLTQAALVSQVGNWGSIFVALAIFMFAFSTIVANSYYGEANLRYFSNNKKVVFLFRLSVVGIVMLGSLASLEFAWSFADLSMALMAICNLIAIGMLGKYSFRLLADYRAQKRAGVKEPTFSKDKLPEIKDDIECW